MTPASPSPPKIHPQPPNNRGWQPLNKSPWGIVMMPSLGEDVAAVWAEYDHRARATGNWAEEPWDSERAWSTTASKLQQANWQATHHILKSRIAWPEGPSPQLAACFLPGGLCLRTEGWKDGAEKAGEGAGKQRRRLGGAICQQLPCVTTHEFRVASGTLITGVLKVKDFQKTVDKMIDNQIHSAIYKQSWT